ncbi:hypothetical protein JYT28_00335, partial [Desulfobulbus sp. AH-315-M07]|nr:hypothetical protein [Desulfobulbus sp. AH-315-M07]
MRAALAGAVLLLGCSSDDLDGFNSGSGAGGSTASGGPIGMGDPSTVAAFDSVRIRSHALQDNFQEATAEIDLGEGPFASVQLTIDLDTTCFPFDKWQTNPPPPGQNFPADCDAFDRNFEWSLNDPLEAGDPPGIELVRAIT